MPENDIGISSLPDEILDYILSFMSYDEVSHNRLVSKRFDQSAQRVLNQGFHKVERFHAQCVRKVKEQLPRRESERRKHPLASHCDILTAIESRLSLLEMTFMKYVELKHCCFIPGKVLDEMFKVLRLVSTTQVPPRSYELLQELRDISSMAMEHFDEKIAPAFRNRRNTNPRLILGHGVYSNSTHYHHCHCSNSTNFRVPTLNQEFIKVHLLYRQLQNKYMKIKRETLEFRRKMMEYRRRLNEMDRILAEQNAVLLQQTAELNVQNVKVQEMSQKYAEYREYLTEIVLGHNERCILCTLGNNRHNYINRCTSKVLKAKNSSRSNEEACLRGKRSASLKDLKTKKRMKK